MLTLPSTNTSLISELTQGRELATTHLRNLLDPSFPREDCELVMDQILAIYNKALNIINFDGSGLDDSPLSELSPRNSNSEVGKLRPSKKRKISSRRMEKVKLNAGEDPLPGDGYGWRKYGQKSILGAKFRRSYFRCTHRHSQGCSAVKQAQPSDDDPTVIDVIYIGGHTCTPDFHISIPFTNTSPPRMHPMPAQQMGPILEPNLTVQTEGLVNNADKFYVRTVSFSVLFDDSTNADNWMAEMDTFGEDSPINKPEFTLEELGIDPDFSFDNLGMFS